MIDNLAGIKTTVTFSGMPSDKFLYIRTDGDKSHCRFSGLKIYGKTKKEANAIALKLCIDRQNLASKHYECENCKCGIEILTGKRKTAPANIELGITK